MSDAGSGAPNPVAYTERPILFRTEDTGAVLYGMERYLAGNGEPPKVDDEMVLSILGPLFYTQVGHETVEYPRRPLLEGVCRVVEVSDSDIDSPFFSKQPESDLAFWGLIVVKVRDIEHEDEIEKIEPAGLVSMI